jgi:hypothetical protein
VLARSVRNPLVIGLGTGIVLVGGSAPAALAKSPTPTSSGTNASVTPSATPTTTKSTPTGTPTTPPPTMSAHFVHMPTFVQPGSSYSADVVVTPHASNGKNPKRVVLAVRGSRATAICDASKDRVYTIGSLKFEKTVPITLSVPANVTSGRVVVYAHVDAGNAPSIDAPSAYLPVKKPTPKPTVSATPTASHSSGSGGGTGSSSGSSGSNSTLAPMGTLNSTTTGKSGSSSGTPPQNAPVLPDTTQTQQPSTAPDPAVQRTSNSQSMRGTGDATGQLTFGKLASTQAAWLAALLVAFSLLLTQVRLGKATAKPVKPKGTHRRPRRRVRHTRAH